MDDFGGLALDEDEGDRLARALGEKRILFLANHGVIVVGPSVAHAFNDLYYLEKACMAQITLCPQAVPLKEFRKRWRSILIRKCREIETTSPRGISWKSDVSWTKRN